MRPRVAQVELATNHMRTLLVEGPLIEAQGAIATLGQRQKEYGLWESSPIGEGGFRICWGSYEKGNMLCVHFV